MPNQNQPSCLHALCSNFIVERRKEATIINKSIFLVFLQVEEYYSIISRTARYKRESSDLLLW